LPNQITTIKAHLDDAEELERLHSRPRQRPTLPSPRPAALAIAVTVLEVQKGVRSPWHLERLSHYTMWPAWDTFANPAPPDLAGAVARPLTLTLQEHTPGLVHATVVLEFAGTAEPLSLALDGARGRWELIELEYSSPDRPTIPPPARGLTAGPPTRIPDPFRRGRVLDGPAGIPLGPPRGTWQLDPAWQPQLPDTLGIELE